MIQGDVNLGSAGEVSSLLLEMFGPNLASGHGVIHVTAVATNRQVLKITSESPTSLYDAFVLSMSRARAHYIVTTGKILREEPDLTHDYLGSALAQRAFLEWRSDVVGIDEPVHVLVLTSGKGVDESHSIFRGPRPVTILTSKQGATTLRDQSFDVAEVVVLDEPNIRKVIDFAARGSNTSTVSVEAGPSTAAVLYESPIVVNELLLSTYHGAVSPTLLSGSFVGEDVLGELFHLESSCRIRNEDGDWTFERYVR